METLGSATTPAAEPVARRGRRAGRRGAGAGVALGLVWLAGAVVLQTPGARPARRHPALDDPARAQRRAAAVGPDPQRAGALRPFPRIDGPPVDLRAARGDRARPRGARASASVVKIQGTACGLGVEGSGWIARDGIVVTNAHVVAGQEDTTVQLGGGGPEPGRARVVFDSATTSPILRVEGSAGARCRSPRSAQRAPAARSSASRRTARTTSRAGRVGATRTVITQDAYGRGPVQRSDRDAARHSCAGQLGRPDGRRARARGGDGVRGHARGTGRAATACPNVGRRRDLARPPTAGVHRGRAPR